MIDQARKHRLLFSMKKIRAVEEKIAEKYSEQKMRCPTHLSIGQESVPAALSEILTKEDLAISTHRGHAHYLGKGGSVNEMIAEIYGKETGCSKGIGGSMHLIDRSVGFMGTTAIVGGSIPVGVGLGMALKLEKSKNISVVFLGDGAIEEGVFYEAANFCAVKKLPVLFVCENNFYSVYSNLKVRQPEGRRIHELVAAIGLKTDYVANGNDIEESFTTLSKTVESMRKNSFPHLVELETYRWLEHCGPNWDNNLGYRAPGEFEKWKKLDPILNYENKLKANNEITADEISQMDQEIDHEVMKAFEFAEKSSFPHPSKAFENLYKSEKPNEGRIL
jgi:pyruvate dehydrogenase E1 component alpha subunit